MQDTQEIYDNSSIMAGRVGIQQGCFPFDVSWNEIDGGKLNLVGVEIPDTLRLHPSSVQIRGAGPRGMRFQRVWGEGQVPSMGARDRVG